MIRDWLPAKYSTAESSLSAEKRAKAIKAFEKITFKKLLITIRLFFKGLFNK